jgi:hypothetical protein
MEDTHMLKVVEGHMSLSTSVEKGGYFHHMN